MKESMPDALRTMTICFQAGLSLQQTMAIIAKEVSGVIGRRFSQAAMALEAGASISEGLDCLKSTESNDGLSFIAVALDIQHLSGGSLEKVLKASQETLESEIRLERSLKAQTAQAKFSAQIVTLMPFILIALFSLLSPHFIESFFSSTAGILLLVCALGLQACGVFWIRRLLQEGGQRL